MNKIPVSVVVITKNEEMNIADCLKSVSWADEVIILDDFSSDNTVAIARQFTNRIFLKRMDIEGRHRNYAYSLAKNNWVLSLDADERATEGLKKEIEEAIQTSASEKAFTIPIKAFIGDYWIRHGGWYPASKVRLFEKNHFKYEEAEVHPRVFIDGSCGHLKGDIVHYSYRNFSDFLQSVDNQTTLEAKKWFNEKRKIGALKAVRKTIDRFLKTYIVKKGYRDGVVGFMVAYFNGLYQLLSYAKYWQMLKGGAKPPAANSANRANKRKKKLSVTVSIIAKNEEENIRHCLESVEWADEIIVVDGYSTDKTPTIAASFGAKVIRHEFGGSFAEERNIGMREAANDWVLHIDADDIVTEDFVKKLEDRLERGTEDITVFKFRRKNFFLDHCMEHGGWHHFVPNLVRKGETRYEGKVHEVPVTQGKIGVIKADIEHYPFKTVSQFVGKQNRYTTIKARELFENEGLMSDRVIRGRMRSKAMRTFWKSYIKKGGFREGFYGFLFAFLFSMIDVLLWAKIWHLCYEEKRRTEAL